jgi:chaperonin cofactor prefoldin
VFPGVEPLNATFCFIGRSSIVAAVGEIFGMTVDDVADRLSDAKQVTKKQVQDLEKKNRVLQTKLDLIIKNLQDLTQDG